MAIVSSGSVLKYASVTGSGGEVDTYASDIRSISVDGISLAEIDVSSISSSIKSFIGGTKDSGTVSLSLYAPAYTASVLGSASGALNPSTYANGADYRNFQIQFGPGADYFEVNFAGYVTSLDVSAAVDGAVEASISIRLADSIEIMAIPNGPLVYGSRRASGFVRDLAIGADSLDLVIIGDSNTGSAQSGMWGYHNGFSQAMFELGWPCYGLPVFPAMYGLTAASSATGGWNSSAFLYAPTGNLASGNISGGATAYNAWTPGDVATVTISNASPGVVTYTAHGLTAGAPLFLATTGALPTGLSAGTTYYVKTVLTADTFTVASTPTGTEINTSSAGSGTHTIQTCPWIRYGSATATPPAKDDWAYIASGSYTQNFNAVEMSVDHPLNDTSLTLWHRVRFGTFTASGGSFQGRARAYDGGPVYATGSVQSTQGAAYSFGAYEYSFSVTAPTEYTHASWSGGAGGAVGPCAIHSHTIYCKRKGWSVTSHGYLAGYDSARITQVAAAIGSTLLQTHLQELRERQIAAGGTGRVLLVSHSGINGNETTSDWTTCHLTIWNTYKAAWESLGYPASDLAIVSFVGVPANQADTSNSGSAGNLVAVRSAASALPGTQRDMTVIDSKTMMPYSRAIVGIGNGRSYYQRTNNLPNAGSDITVHLSGGIYNGSTRDTSDGYTVVAHEILQSLLNNA